MHLISSLVAGIRGAEIGSVELLEFGTSTHAVYYKDFQASQQYSAQPIPLDSFGSVTLYVDQLVDVLVHDVNGVLVRQFVAGVEDAAVEVISPSFTGVDCRTGQVGVQKPTDLEKVLDSWAVSAGAPDWKVFTSDGVKTLTAAFTGITSPFVNVKKFGAQGNGVTDDRTAIVNAITSLDVDFGGIVYFPPGIYRVTGPIQLPRSIGLLGGTGISTTIALDAGASSSLFQLGSSGQGHVAWVSGLRLGLLTPGGHVLIAGTGSAGEYQFVNCIIGNGIAGSFLCQNTGSVAGSKLVFERCYIRQTSSSPAIRQTGVGELIVSDCDIITESTTITQVVTVETNAIIRGNRFSAPNIGIAAIDYIAVTDSSAVNPIIVSGNYFAPCISSPTPVALKNKRTTATTGWFEHSNVFGNMGASPSGCTPYAYDVDGNTFWGQYYIGNGTRLGRVEAIVTTPGSTVAVNPKAYGTTVLGVSPGAGGQVHINANKGSFGDRWTLEIYNNSGSTISFFGDTNFAWPTGVFTFATGVHMFMHMAWLASGDAPGTGFWYMTGKEQSL